MFFLIKKSLFSTQTASGKGCFYHVKIVFNNAFMETNVNVIAFQTQTSTFIYLYPISAQLMIIP